MAAPYIYVIGNCVPYDIKTLREDATGAQMKMQADACAHQRAKSRKAILCSSSLRTTCVEGALAPRMSRKERRGVLDSFVRDLRSETPDFILHNLRKGVNNMRRLLKD